MKSIKDTVGDDKKDWKQRNESVRLITNRFKLTGLDYQSRYRIISISFHFLQMKKLRGIIIAGGASFDNFTECLKNVQRPFEAACMDLRSQVVREAAITLAFLSQQLRNKFATFGECVLPTLINLIQNSAKVKRLFFFLFMNLEN